VRNLIVSLVVGLSACATQSSYTRLSAAWDDAGAKCKEQGFAIPSSEFSACRERLYAIAEHAESADQQARAAALDRSVKLWAIGSAILTQSPPVAPPAPVVCRTYYSGTVCQ
jgi:hypothetical protein